MAQLFELSATEAAARIRARELSPVELVQALLARIEALEPTVRAWVRVDAEGALATAREREQQAREGRILGPLHGVPVGLKDIYHAAGLPTEAGFRPFANQIAAEDAASVARLRAAGAIILGKTVTTQFALADPPPTTNPWNLQRTPGGSSSGSAAGVAARMIPAALGTQTAGSVLRPAAYCGVVGLKPTFGRISRRGILPFSWSLDHPGPIVRTVEDAALLLQVLAGHDPQDPASADVPVDDYVGAAAGTGSGPAGPRVGLVEDFLERAAPQTTEHVRQVAGRLEAAGARVDSVRLPSSLDLVLAVHHVIMQVEGAALHAHLLARYPDEYGPQIRAFVQVGQLLPGPTYVHALRLLRRLRNEVDGLLAGFDCLLTPTISDVAPEPSTTGDRSFQAPWTLLGLPSISLPSGLSPDRLPLAIQLTGPRFQETRLLSAARWCEDVLGRLPDPLSDQVKAES